MAGMPTPQKATDKKTPKRVKIDFLMGFGHSGVSKSESAQKVMWIGLDEIVFGGFWVDFVNLPLRQQLVCCVWIQNMVEINPEMVGFWVLPAAKWQPQIDGLARCGVKTRPLTTAAWLSILC